MNSVVKLASRDTKGSGFESGHPVSIKRLFSVTFFSLVTFDFEIR